MIEEGESKTGESEQVVDDIRPDRRSHHTVDA